MSTNEDQTLYVLLNDLSAEVRRDKNLKWQLLSLSMIVFSLLIGFRFGGGINIASS